MVVIAIFVAIPMCIYIICEDWGKITANPKGDEAKGLRKSALWTLITLVGVPILWILIVVIFVLIKMPSI